MSTLLQLLKIRALASLHWRRNLREQSAFKIAFILFFAAGMLAGLWALFLEGFTFLDRMGGVGLIIIPRMFALFFFGLSLMLMLSSLLTTYTSLYRSEETAYLLLRPVPLSELLVFKHLESAFYASWAFFFIIIPFVGAYAWYDRLPWYFSLWTLLFAIPFVGFCSGAGNLLTLLVVRYLPRTRRVAITLLILVPLLLGAIWIASTPSAQSPDSTTLMLSRLLPGLKAASFPLLPSWWLSEGLLALSRHQWARGLLLWLVLLANWLAMALAVEFTGRRIFMDGWQAMLSGSTRTRRLPVLFPGLERRLSALPADLRGLLLKDVRIFVRDPQQWIQVLVFFGLLGLYFLNLRTLRYHQLDPQWRNLIGFLNIFSTSAVLCSLGSRFVYPQMSLEGQAFWIIGMAPTAMKRVLAAKFIGACAAMLAVSLGLILISVRMLALPPLAQAVAIFIAAAVAVAIAGLSTGLGAVFLDLHQRNPAAIVSSFGGTLNLVISLCFMLAAIFPFGALFHFYSLALIGKTALLKGLAAGIPALTVLTALAAWLPLVAGRKTLERREYS